MDTYAESAGYGRPTKDHEHSAPASKCNYRTEIHDNNTEATAASSITHVFNFCQKNPLWVLYESLICEKNIYGVRDPKGAWGRGPKIVCHQVLLLLLLWSLMGIYYNSQWRGKNKIVGIEALGGPRGSIPSIFILLEISFLSLGYAKHQVFNDLGIQGVVINLQQLGTNAMLQS